MSIRGKCNSCCVPGCSSNTTPSFRSRGGRVTTFRIPKDEKRRKEWIQAIPKRKYPPTVNHNVCILHFNEEDFSRNNRRIDLKKSAVPSIFPFVNGQRTEDNADISDEVWIEYVEHKKNPLKETFGHVDNNELPAPISDISRILIERLRIPGSKYFGIDTAEITIEPDSDHETDLSEPKAVATNSNIARNITKSTNSPIKRKRKSKKSEQEWNLSIDDTNDYFDNVTDSQSVMEEHIDNVHVNRFPIKSETEGNVQDSADKFGAMVSSKLLLMSSLQRLMSQKIISEILLKGQLGMLKPSMSPVVVSGYMKNISSGRTKTKNVVTVDCLSPTYDEYEDESGGCDPLMSQVKRENIRNTHSDNMEFVKNEVVWSDDD